MYKLIINLIPNDLKHLAALTETAQTPLLKTFYYNNKSIRKVKDFQKLSNREILQQTIQIYIS